MRGLRTGGVLMVAVAITGCGKSDAPSGPAASSTASGSSASKAHRAKKVAGHAGEAGDAGEAGADVPERERVRCRRASCEVGTVTARTRAELEAHTPHVSAITLGEGATQEDLEALRGAHLPELRTVRLSKSPRVKDLAPLATFTKLRTIDVLDTGITTLAPLAGLPELEAISLATSANRSEQKPGDASKKPAAPEPAAPAPAGVATDVDIAAIAQIKSLRALRLTGVTVKTLEPLRSTTLTELRLTRMHLADAEPVAALTGLATLALTETSTAPTVGVEWIGKLTSLKGLTLTGMRLKSLDLVAKLTGLSTLTANDNPEVASLAPVAKLDQLTLLYVDGTSVEDLTPLAGLAKLANLTVSRTKVKSLGPLAKLTALTMFQATDTSVTDLKPLYASTNLGFVALPKSCPEAEVEALKKALPKVQVSR